MPFFFLIILEHKYILCFTERSGLSHPLLSVDPASCRITASPPSLLNITAFTRLFKQIRGQETENLLEASIFIDCRSTPLIQRSMENPYEAAVRFFPSFQAAQAKPLFFFFTFLLNCFSDLNSWRWETGQQNVLPLLKAILHSSAEKGTL